MNSFRTDCVREIHENTEEYSGFIKDAKYYDKVNNYRLIEKEGFPWHQLIYKMSFCDFSAYPAISLS